MILIFKRYGFFKIRKGDDGLEKIYIMKGGSLLQIKK